VDASRTLLADHVPALGHFDTTLLRAGYLDAHRQLYEEPRYSLREIHVYEVIDGFPRITEKDIPSGVGAVSYRIQVAALATFAVDTGRPAEAFKEAK
jgi:Putative  PD-(D/E)XK family member, (DUF4420)